MNWCFALINNRLAEIYFDKTKGGKRKIHTHCYVRRNEFRTRHEQEMINADIKMVRLVYRDKQYHDKTKADSNKSFCG